MDIYNIDKKENTFTVTISEYNIGNYNTTITNLPNFNTTDATHPLNQNITLTN